MAFVVTDADLLTLCAFQEANLEPDEGIAAVVRVVLNRTRLRYASDGTIAGTIERHDQFSWTEWAMVSGHYIRVADGPAAELARVQKLLAASEGYTRAWARCAAIVAQVQAWTFSGPLFDQLTDHTVLYDNTALAQPDWIAQSRFVVAIGHHRFYEPNTAPTASAPSGIDATKAAIGAA